MAITSWWIRSNITSPLLALDKAAREFAFMSRDPHDERQFAFEPPATHTNNEIETLSMSITKMASDIRTHVGEVLAAQQHASDVERENARIAEQAKSAQKIAELSESVRALFVNMPGLSFSKDAKTGVYLACNQAFAEYAHKPNPDGVVGLTDHQIFDPVTAQHFVDDDAKTLSMDEPYVFFEDVFDAAGNPKQFQTTKMKFYDTKGRLCTLGHQAGDKLLKQACSIICNVFKRSPVFRVGGDEFVTILEGHDYRHRNELLQRLSNINDQNERTGDAVIAWGISCYRDDSCVADVFSRADARMYANKRALKGER